MSAALLWLALRQVDVDQALDSLRKADPALAAGAGALLFLTYPVLAMRWAGLARALGPAPVNRMLEFSIIGIAVNNTVPGRLGEVARAVGLARSVRESSAKAFGTVVVDRIADVLVLVLALGATLPLVPDAEWLRWLGIGAAAVAVAAILLVVTSVTLLRARPPSRNPRRVRRYVRHFAEGLDCLTGARVVVRALLLTVLAWSLWISAAILAARALDISLSPLEAAFLAAVLNLGTAIPSSPGFVGTYQWLAVSAMGLLGIAADGAFAFSVLLQALWFVPTTLLGVMVMLRLGWTVAGIRRASLDMERLRA